MPAKHEDDAADDRLGAEMSRSFLDLGGKVETVTHRTRDPYLGDGRTALGDQMASLLARSASAECRWRARWKAIAKRLRSRLAEECRAHADTIKQRDGMGERADQLFAIRENEQWRYEEDRAKLVAEMEHQRAAITAYVAARDKEQRNAFFVIEDAERTETAYEALKAAAGITTEGGIADGQRNEN